MEVTVTTDPRLFSRAAAPVLRAHPIAANVIAGLLERALRDRLGGDAVWLAVLDGGSAVALAVRTPPRNLVLTPAPPGMAGEVAAVLAARARAEGMLLPGVTGTRPEALAFAGQWSALAGTGYRESMAQRMYATGRIAPPSGVPGRSRPAGGSDVDLCATWLHEFHREATPGDPPPEPDWAARRIADGSVRLWEVDGRPVSLAAATPAVGGVSRIGPVYSPPPHRSRGYASAITADTGLAALAAGAERCMLYTDLANPVSNAIYRRLGFRAVADAVVYRFTDPSQESTAPDASGGSDARAAPGGSDARAAPGGSDARAAPGDPSAQASRTTSTSAANVASE